MPTFTSYRLIGDINMNANNSLNKRNERGIKRTDSRRNIIGVVTISVLVVLALIIFQSSLL